MHKLKVLSNRSCDGCVKCCEGWLEADIRGHKMRTGKPCFYLSSNSLGCSAYDDRPKDPCRDYRCVWLEDESFPDALKPSVSGVLVTKRQTFLPGDDGMKRVDYYEIKSASPSVSPAAWDSVLLWLKDKQFLVVVVDAIQG